MSKKGDWLLFNKRGQVTIFIIIALVLIAGIAFYTLIRGKAAEIKQSYRSSENPQQYIAECVEDAARPAISELLMHGGFTDPELNTTYKGVEIAYLCYTSLNYEPCVNQVPLYSKHLNDELKESIRDDVEECFSSMKYDYEQKKFSVELGETKNFDVHSTDRKVIINISRELTIMNRDEEARTYKDFKISINSPMYNLGRVVQEIVAQEATFCHSEYLGYQTLYPWVKITKTDINGKYKVYEVTDRNTGEKLNFAVKGCSIPPV